MQFRSHVAMAVRAAALALWAASAVAGQSSASVADLPPTVHPDRLVVRAASPEAARRWTAAGFGTAASTVAARITAVQPLFAGGDHTAAWWFDRFSVWHAELAGRLGPAAPRDLGCYLRVVVGDPAARGEVAAALAALPGVEAVEAEPIAVLSGGLGRGARQDLPPPTPDWSRDQPWFAPAPAAFGLGFAHGILGGRGRGVAIWHVENDWRVDHEDLDTITAASWLGGPPASRVDPEHGTAVLGLLAADRNAFGVTGSADRATVRLASILRLGGYPGALASVIAAGAPGDVIALILAFDIREIQPRDLVPVEYFDPWFQAIRSATGLGFHVVEAAGNGGNDLDHPRFLGRFDRSVRDSGAILVGGTDGQRFVRTRESNFGSRVDCAAWAGDVVTTGYGSLFLPGTDMRQAYTELYSGTSTASSLVSAIVADFVGAVRRQLGRTATVAEVRDLLTRLGTPVVGDIGRRPDLAAMLAAVGLPDGLTVAAVDVDNGTSARFRVDGAAGAQAFVLVGPVLADLAVGANRPLHVDLGSALVLPPVALGGAPVEIPLPIPADPALAGLELFGQAVCVVPGGTLSVGSSVQVRVR